MGSCACSREPLRAISRRVPRGHGKAALRAPGLEYRRPHDLRHSNATFSNAAELSLFALASRMGTSLEMIDKTYGHLAPDADDYELGLLDAFDARDSEVVGHLLDTADRRLRDHACSSGPFAAFL